MKLLKIGKYVLLILIYACVFIWIGIKIGGEPQSTYAKMIHQIPKAYTEIANDEGVVYSMNTEYITRSGHDLFLITGYETEINERIGKFTVDSVVLESDACLYSVDIIRDKLDYAARYVKSEVESDKIVYKAIIPTQTLETGRYKIGLLLENNVVIWSSEYLSVQPYFRVWSDAEDTTADNELHIMCDELWYNRSLDCLEGIGATWGTEMIVINNNGSKSMEISMNAKVEQDNTYFVFVCNNVTLMQEMLSNEKDMKFNFPLEDGENVIYVYYLSEEEKNNTEGASYYFRDLDVKFSDETLDIW